MKSYIVVLAMCIAFAHNSFALLKIDITKGNVDPIPIAIGKIHFQGDNGAEISEQVRKIVESDLKSSGLFEPIDHKAFLESVDVNAEPNHGNWRKIGAAAFTTGKVFISDNKITLEFRLWDPALQQQIAGSSFTATTSSYRRVAHKMADQVYSRLTGESGYFDTRIVFVAESGPFLKRVKKLAIMDRDGANYKELTDGKTLVLTPRFDPNSQRVIYMSYRKQVPHVYLLELQTGEQRLVGDFVGMSFAPRFSPDGKSAVFSVAQNGATDIYEITLSSGSVERLTNTPRVINTSPTYSPDSNKIAFTSDRGGKTQIYVMDRNGDNVQRISFGDGSYSAPAWSPRGDFIAFTKSKDGLFYIGVMRPDGSGERLLTSSWMDEGPTWSPNGRVIIFSRQTKGGGYKLYSVDVTGYGLKQIHTPTDASDPAWSPLLH